jgi:hypothetical protein
MQYHKDAFNNTYAPIWEHVQKSAVSRNTLVHGNAQGHTFYRNNLVFTNFEQMFDVKLEAHAKISHARDPKSNKSSSMMTCACMEFQ